MQPPDTRPNAGDGLNISWQRLNQLLFLAASGSVDPGLAASPDDSINESAYKCNQILYTGTFGGGGGAVAWGAITGTLNNQSDLKTQLDLKQTAAQVQALIDAIHGGTYATTATAAGTTTLTSASAYQQFFTGSTTQNINLPVASTLYLGFSFVFVNNSSASITIRTSGVINVIAIPSGGAALVSCILASGTGSDSWSVSPLPSSTLLASIAPNGAFFDPTGGGITDPVLIGDVQGLTYIGAGVYRFVFAVGYSDANYIVTATSETQDVPGFFSIKNKNASGFDLISSTPSADVVTGEISYTRADPCAIAVNIRK